MNLSRSSHRAPQQTQQKQSFLRGTKNWDRPLSLGPLASLVVQWVKNLPATQETQEMWVQYLGGEDPLEEEMAIHYNMLV